MPDRRDSEREKKPVPKVLDRQYLEACYNAMDQLCFKPEPHIFIDIQVCIPVFVLQRPGGRPPVQYKADRYILFCIEPYGRCAMTSQE